MRNLRKTISFLTATASLIFTTMSCFAHIVSIADRGAVSGDKSINTAAIQTAIDECAGNGGGTVLVPPGVWVTGSIELKSQVTLRLEAGAILRGSAKIADYPTNGFKHLEMGDTTSLIWAIRQKDISICGEGAIELADRPFFDWNQLRTGLPAEQDGLLQDWQRKQCVVAALKRPNQPIFFHGCRGLRVSGVTIRHASCWTLTFSCCEDIQVRGVRIDNDLQIPNDDGIHFSGSKNIVVSDCIIRGGDDSLAFTGITDPDSVCENITVTNCILTSRSAGVRLGHLSGKVRDVTLSNLVIKDCSRGFAIQASDNGWVENVMISNIVMETKMFAGAWWGKGEPLVISAANSDSARIRGISVNHVRSRAQNSILIVGQNHNVSDITLNDVQVTYGYSPNTPLYGQTFDLAPAPLRPSFLGKNHMPWLYADSISGLDLRNISYRQADSSEPKLSLEPVITNVDHLVASPAE
ncbi:MAG: glycosyl hydrolase family 28 protein [Opitutaceae bacterium]|jgi:polygalacturonase